MTDHPNYKYRPRRRKHAKPRAGAQNVNNTANNTSNNAKNNSNSSLNSGVQLISNSNGTPSSTPSTHNQSSSSDVQYERMSPYSYNNMYYNDGSTITSPGQSTPSPSPPDGRHNKKMVYKMEEVPTPEMSPMEMSENIHSASSKIDYEQALPASSSHYNNTTKNHRYGYDTSGYEAGTKNDYHYGNNERLYEDQHQASANHHVEKKPNYGCMPQSVPSTTIAAMGNGMYVMCSNRGVLDQGHIVTGTYFPPLPTSQDHQNLGSSNILTSSSHHHHHYMNTQTTSLTSSLAANQIMSSGSNDLKYKSNDTNNNKHGSENNNKTNKTNEMNNSKSESKSFKNFKDKTASKCDIDDKLIKNDSNNNSNQDNKNSNKNGDMTQNVNNNRLVLSSPALSPYHHQSYLSQYKNHINYSDQAIQQHQSQQDEINDQQSNMNKYNNFSEYDPYQNNTIYYHPSTHFAHSHPSLNSLPPTSAAPTAFYVTNPEYYHQSYAMSSTVPVSTTLVQPMVAKIDAVIGATAIPLHHPVQTLMSDPFVTPEQLKEDDFSNILAGVRKTCYSN